MLVIYPLLGSRLDCNSTFGAKDILQTDGDESLCEWGTLEVHADQEATIHEHQVYLLKYPFTSMHPVSKNPNFICGECVELYKFTITNN